MLQNIIKIGKKTKVVNSSNVGSIEVGLTITRTSGNISTINSCYARVYERAGRFKGKAVLSIEDYDCADINTLIDGEVVNLGGLVAHLNTIGLSGLSSKLEFKVKELNKTEGVDIAKALLENDTLKKFFGDFVMWELLTREEWLEVK